MHRHEDGVSPRQREEKVQLAQGFIHHAPEHFREPIIRRRKNAEDRGHAHDQMKVSDHKVSIVQLNVEHRLRQERPAQTARHK